MHGLVRSVGSVWFSKMATTGYFADASSHLTAVESALVPTRQSPTFASSTWNWNSAQITPRTGPGHRNADPQDQSDRRPSWLEPVGAGTVGWNALGGGLVGAGRGGLVPRPWGTTSVLGGLRA